MGLHRKGQHRKTRGASRQRTRKNRVATVLQVCALLIPTLVIPKPNAPEETPAPHSPVRQARVRSCTLTGNGLSRTSPPSQPRTYGTAGAHCGAAERCRRIWFPIAGPCFSGPPDSGTKTRQPAKPGPIHLSSCSSGGGARRAPKLRRRCRPASATGCHRRLEDSIRNFPEPGPAASRRRQCNQRGQLCPAPASVAPTSTQSSTAP